MPGHQYLRGFSGVRIQYMIGLAIIVRVPPIIKCELPETLAIGRGQEARRNDLVGVYVFCLQDSCL